jgi:hypothetical protein
MISHNVCYVSKNVPRRSYRISYGSIGRLRALLLPNLQCEGEGAWQTTTGPCFNIHILAAVVALPLANSASQANVPLGRVLQGLYAPIRTTSSPRLGYQRIQPALIPVPHVLLITSCSLIRPDPTDRRVQYKGGPWNWVFGQVGGMGLLVLALLPSARWCLYRCR